MIAVLFMNHDLTKIEVNNPIILNLSLLVVFTSLTLLSLKKTVGEKPLSVLQTNQIKGLAIIIIIIHHLSVHTIKNSQCLRFFENIGFVGVSTFLILSGFGISISLENKGIKNFFSKRLARVYIPVIFAMLIEVFLSHILSGQNSASKIINDITKIFYDLDKVDRNMWFVVFIIFWYCMMYLVYQLNLSTKAKLFFLFSTSLIFLCMPQVPISWKINAFSFPVGCWLGFNSNLIARNIETLLNRNIAMFFGVIVSFLLLSKLTNYVATKLLENGYQGSVFMFSSVAILGLTYIIRKKVGLENIFQLLAISIIYLNFFSWSAKPDLAGNIIESTVSVMAAFAIIISVCILVKLNLSSVFLNFIGIISFELYLLHGMFMYSYDFILFRGNIALTFFIYFIVICLVSVAFKKLNSILYDLILDKANV